MGKRSIGGRILLRVLGFFIFLVLIGLAKVLAVYVTNDFYSAIVEFFIDNLFLSFLIFFVTLIGDIFWGFFFPFNLPAPIISAIASIFIVSYIYKLWIFIDSYLLSGVNIPLSLLTTIVFWIVLIGGYIAIIVKLFGWNKLIYERKEKGGEKREEEIKEEEKDKEERIERKDKRKKKKRK